MKKLIITEAPDVAAVEPLALGVHKLLHEKARMKDALSIMESDIEYNIETMRERWGRFDRIDIGEPEESYKILGEDGRTVLFSASKARATHDLSIEGFLEEAISASHTQEAADLVVKVLMESGILNALSVRLSGLQSEELKAAYVNNDNPGFGRRTYK